MKKIFSLLLLFLFLLSGCESSNENQDIVPVIKKDYLSMVQITEKDELNSDYMFKNLNKLEQLEIYKENKSYTITPHKDFIASYEDEEIMDILKSKESKKISIPKNPVKEKIKFIDISLDVSASTSKDDILKNLKTMEGYLFLGKNEITPKDQLLFRVYGYDSEKQKMVTDTLSISIDNYQFELMGRVNGRKDYFNAVLVPFNECKGTKENKTCTSVYALKQEVRNFYQSYITEEKYHKYSYFLSHLETIHTNNRRTLDDYKMYQYIFITDGAFNIQPSQLVNEKKFNPLVEKNNRDYSIQYRPLQAETFINDSTIFDLYYKFLGILKGGRTMCDKDDGGSVLFIGIDYAGNSEYLKKIEEFYKKILTPCPVDVYFK